MIEQTEPANSIPPEASYAASEFRPLDPRVVGLWRASNLLGAAFLLAVLLAGGVAVALAEPAAWPWVLLAWVLFAAWGAWLSFWRPARLYRSWGYRIDEKVLETRSGLLFHVARLLPLSRLQHVDLHRGPLERAYGLASLILHTAGTHEATITIPGLDAEEAARLRDRLIEAGGDDGV
jgi:membrane protein YdbS with pleckstrin-like domain